MALEKRIFEEFEFLRVTTQRGYTYDYCKSAAKEGKPTILFLHGFPSGKGNYNQLSKLCTSEGYGVILPSLLGYAPTSQPTDVKAYNGKGMAQDVTDILDHEKVEKFVLVAHDHGCGLASHVLVYHQHRILATVFFNVGYAGIRNQPFEMAKFNAIAQTVVGYESNGYFAFLGQVPTTQTANIIRDHADSAITLLCAKDSELWRNHFCPTGAFEQWLKSDSMCERDPDVTREYIDYGMEVLTSSIDTALLWYGAMLENVNLGDAQKLNAEQMIIKTPFLFLGGGKDVACPPQLYFSPGKPLIEDLQQHIFPDLSHWMPELNAGEMWERISRFLREKSVVS